MTLNGAFPIRVIWVTPKFPLGAPDGARHATCVLLRHLSQIGVMIDLICMTAQDEPMESAAAQKELGVRTCSFVRRGSSMPALFSALRIPFTFRSFTLSKVKTAFKQKLTELFMDHDKAMCKTFAVFDGLHPFAAMSPDDLKRLCSKSVAVVYRAHNFESALWEQCAKKARLPWMRWLFKYQAALVREFEHHITKTVSWVAPVSEEDVGKFKSLAPEAVVSSIPIGIDMPAAEQVSPVDIESKRFEVLFVGRLDWLPNRMGLSWFLEKVWPELVKKRPDAMLNIAGVGKGGWLKKFSAQSSIQCLGRVEHLEPLYRSCALTIAPLFQGSGTRVKILESSRYARPALSTGLGAEGTGLSPGISLYQAETQEEWIRKLETLTLKECQKTGWNAFLDIRERFNGRSIAQRFVTTLVSLPSRAKPCFP